MSRSHALQEHRHNLQDIHSLMRSMKSLAQMDWQKVERSSTFQALLLEQVEGALSRVLMSAEFEVCPHSGSQMLICIGTERGFCGDLPRRVHAEMLQYLATCEAPVPLICVGTKLIDLIGEQTTIDYRECRGANLNDEIAGVMDRLIEQLLNLGLYTESTIDIIAFNDQGALAIDRILPPNHSAICARAGHTVAQVSTHLDTEQLLDEITAQYLVAKLQLCLTHALAHETQARIAHLENAVQHLDQELFELQKQVNKKRQEEITQEIELILLSTGHKRPS